MHQVNVLLAKSFNHLKTLYLLIHNIGTLAEIFHWTAKDHFQILATMVYMNAIIQVFAALDTPGHSVIL